MVQRRGCARLYLKTHPACRIECPGAAQQLDGDRRMKPRVGREEHFPHSASAQPGLEAIRTEGSRVRGRRCRRQIVGHAKWRALRPFLDAD